MNGRTGKPKREGGGKERSFEKLFPLRGGGDDAPPRQGEQGEEEKDEDDDDGDLPEEDPGSAGSGQVRDPDICARALVMCVYSPFFFLDLLLPLPLIQPMVSGCVLLLQGSVGHGVASGTSSWPAWRKLAAL